MHLVRYLSTGGTSPCVGVQAFTRMMAGMADCELCDMDLSYCEHGLAQRRQSASADAQLLLISPNKVAHFPGCFHKGDHEDYSGWAELDTPRAWQRLGNGERLAATGGKRADLIAESRCPDCDAHGAW
jgi:hypothetical protein